MMIRHISILAVLLWIASPASAEDATSLNKQGLEAALAKDWATALVKFEQSYALAPKPLTLYNLAAAQEHTDHLIASRGNYARYLAESKPGPDQDRFRAAAKAKLVALEKEIPTLTIKALGFSSSVVLELDQRPLLANELGVPFQLDPGPHVVIARRDTEVLARKELAITRGAREEITLTAPLPKVEKPPPPPVIVRKPPPVPDERPSGGALRSGWFWGAVSVVLIGGAAAYYFLYYDRTEVTPGTLGRGVIEI